MKTQTHMGTAATAILIFFLAACASTPAPTDVARDKSFTPSAIVAGKLGIGGVVSIETPDGLDSAASQAYAALLWQAMGSVRQDLDILPVTAVATRLADDPYQHILREYQSSAHVTKASLLKLNDPHVDFRYLVLARIIDNDVTETQEKTPRYGTPPKRDATGQLVVEAIEMTLKTTRRIEVVLDIYDLRDMILAFSGRIDKRYSNSRVAYSEAPDENLGRTVTAFPIRVLLESTLQPEPPQTDTVLRIIFTGFAKHLP